METYKPTPLKERKSQKLNFWDFAKERLFWGALPFLAGGAAILFGKLTKFKIWPLDGSPDIITHGYATLLHHLTPSEEVKLVAKKLNNGTFAEEVIASFGAKKDKVGTLRRYYYNFIKGAEVATPFSVYFLWHKREGSRLDLEDVDNKLHGLSDIKPSNADLAQQNEVMRKELEFAKKQSSTPPADIDMLSAEHQGKLVERERALS